MQTGKGFTVYLPSSERVEFSESAMIRDIRNKIRKFQCDQVSVVEKQKLFQEINSLTRNLTSRLD